MDSDVIQTTPDTIVLIHGLWMTPLSWEHWVSRYTSRGYTVHAPAWPGLDGDVERLREDPSRVAELGVAEIVDHHDALIRALARPPIIMGHRLGGLFTQLLLDRGLGAAGVAINPAGFSPHSDDRAPLLLIDLPHFTVGAPGWEHVADYALSWAVSHGTTDHAAIHASDDGAPVS